MRARQTDELGVPSDRAPRPGILEVPGHVTAARGDAQDEMVREFEVERSINFGECVHHLAAEQFEKQAQLRGVEIRTELRACQDMLTPGRKSWAPRRRGGGAHPW